MKNGEMRNFDIETENFGVVGIMWIPSEKILKKSPSISVINSKKMRKKVN